MQLALIELVMAAGAAGPPLTCTSAGFERYSDRLAGGLGGDPPEDAIAATRQGNRWTIVGLHYSPIAQPAEPAAQQ